MFLELVTAGPPCSGNKPIRGQLLTMLAAIIGIQASHLFQTKSCKITFEMLMWVRVYRVEGVSMVILGKCSAAVSVTARFENEAAFPKLPLLCV